MSDVWVGRLVVIVCSVLGSGGFWAFIQVTLRKRDSRREATTRLMMGLAYIQITTLGLHYIDRGSITKDEYEDFEKYFYKPYRELGGNGVAQRIMRDVTNLPFQPHIGHAEIFRNSEEGWLNNVRVVSATEGASAER